MMQEVLDSGAPEFGLMRPARTTGPDIKPFENRAPVFRLSAAQIGKRIRQACQQAGQAYALRGRRPGRPLADAGEQIEKKCPGAERAASARAAQPGAHGRTALAWTKTGAGSTKWKIDNLAKEFEAPREQQG